MPYVKKSTFKTLLHYHKIFHVIQSEFQSHDEFVKKYENIFLSRCGNSNFQEIKQKRDLLKDILKK